MSEAEARSAPRLLSRRSGKAGPARGCLRRGYLEQGEAAWFG